MKRNKKTTPDKARRRDNKYYLFFNLFLFFNLVAMRREEHQRLIPYKKAGTKGSCAIQNWYKE